MDGREDMISILFHSGGCISLVWTPQSRCLSEELFILWEMLKSQGWIGFLSLLRRASKSEAEMGLSFLYKNCYA